ncbi:hypothetical protein C4D60_Mb04t34230 [Musa balbisiana]|uniref:Uncharacterized protein n=1 Tax=Musa balbisiana TaxID=52838 RepID=A0A4S8KGN9_MUSBA|nr:hypothetical protein C4D60_Mb04t34230 [Musa balbisiana]
MARAERGGATAAEKPTRADPKVAKLRLQPSVEEDVCGLHVAVHNLRVAPFVQVVERLRHLVRDRHPPRPRQHLPAAVELLVEVAVGRSVRERERERRTAVVAVAEEADDVGVAEAEEYVELLAEGAVEALAGAVELKGSERGVREAGKVDGAAPALTDHRGGGELPGERLDLRAPEPPGRHPLLLLRLLLSVGAVGNASPGRAELQVVRVAAPAAERHPVPAEHRNVDNKAKKTLAAEVRLMSKAR